MRVTAPNSEQRSESATARQTGFCPEVCREETRERSIVGPQLCVVVCVATLASLPVSHEFALYRSGTGEWQGTATKAA